MRANKRELKWLGKDVVMRYKELRMVIGQERALRQIGKEYKGRVEDLRVKRHEEEGRTLAF